VPASLPAIPRLVTMEVEESLAPPAEPEAMPVGYVPDDEPQDVICSQVTMAPEDLQFEQQHIMTSTTEVPPSPAPIAPVPVPGSAA